jgi:hypothetical protein
MQAAKVAPFAAVMRLMSEKRPQASFSNELVRGAHQPLQLSEPSLHVPLRIKELDRQGRAADIHSEIVHQPPDGA